MDFLSETRTSATTQYASESTYRTTNQETASSATSTSTSTTTAEPSTTSEITQPQPTEPSPVPVPPQEHSVAENEDNFDHHQKPHPIKPHKTPAQFIRDQENWNFAFS